MKTQFQGSIGFHKSSIKSSAKSLFTARGNFCKFRISTYANSFISDYIFKSRLLAHRNFQNSLSVLIWIHQPQIIKCRGRKFLGTLTLKFQISTSENSLNKDFIFNSRSLMDRNFGKTLNITYAESLSMNCIFTSRS